MAARPSALASLRAVIASVPGAAAFVEEIPQEQSPSPLQGGQMSPPVYRDPAKLCGACRFFKPWESNDRVGTCQNASARKDGYSVGRRDGCADFAAGAHAVQPERKAAGR